MDIVIVIDGSGQDMAIAAELRRIARQLESGDHLAKLNKEGSLTWETPDLVTVIDAVDEANRP